MRRMPSWSQKSRQELFWRIFALGIFWGRVSHYAATPLIVALSTGHSDITRFHTWSPIATGNHWIMLKKFQKLLGRLAPLLFLIRIQAFQDPLHGELPHVQIVMNDGPNPLKWDAQLLSYWFSWNPAVFQDELVNLINNLLGGHCFGSSRMRCITGGKINWATLFLTVAYDGACSPNVSFRMVWISFRALPCREKKLDDSLRLDVIEITRVAWHASFQPL